MINRCDCTPDTYGPQCASKYNDCEQGSKQLCKHGICEDLERVQHGQVCSPPSPPTGLLAEATAALFTTVADSAPAWCRE